MLERQAKQKELTTKIELDKNKADPISFDLFKKFIDKSTEDPIKNLQKDLQSSVNQLFL